jgi:tetratricopeptide (TPR) repeat protein
MCSSDRPAAGHGATLFALLAGALLAACAPVAQKPGDAPRVPTISESQLREKARQSLAQGVEHYDAGRFTDASNSLTAALDHGQLTRPEQGTARKYLAFMHCASGRQAQCRDEFRKALEIDPAFDLSAAESGHPIWGPVYRDVRAQLSSAAAAAAAPKPPPPRPGAEGVLDQGLAKYAAGEFEEAAKLLADALKKGLAAKPDQINALKHSAFSLCLLGRRVACRNEFGKILAIEPGFDLAPAEAGHPSWAKVFAEAKSRAKAKPAAKPVAKPAAKK